MKIPQGWHIGDLPTLLDLEAAGDLLAQSDYRITSMQRDYLRLKSPTSALVGFQLADPGDATAASYLHVRTFADRDEARALGAKWANKRSRSGAAGPGVSLLRGAQSVPFLFPNDNELPHLRWVTDVDKLKRIVGPLAGRRDASWRVKGTGSSLRQVRYKPERRYIAQASFVLRREATKGRGRSDVFLRLFTDGRGARLDSLLRALQQRIGARVPEPVGVYLDGRLTLEQAVRGEEAFARLQRGDLEVEGIVEGVSALHRSTVAIAPVRPVAAVRDEALAALEVLVGATPAARRATEHLRRELLRAAPEEVAPVLTHGDLHLHQMLVRADEVVFVDLERAAMGQPLHDLGTLVAHTLASGVRNELDPVGARDFVDRLIDAYMARASVSLPAASLRFFTICGLVARALLSLRRLENDWEEQAMRLLETALSAEVAPLGEAARGATRFFSRPARVNVNGQQLSWRTFYPRPTGSWPGVLEDDRGHLVYGCLDPASGHFTRVEPEHDPALPALASWKRRGEIVSYRPLQRATVRVEGASGRMYAKILRPGKARRLQQRARALEAVAQAPPRAFQLPPLVSDLVDQGVVAFGEVAGRPLGDVLRCDTRSRRRALEAVAPAIAAFHRTPVAGVALPEGPRAITATEWSDFVIGQRPEVADEYAQVCRILPQPAVVGPASQGLAHGDLHDGNIVMGEPVGILDIDHVHVGSCVEDVGNFGAHLILRALQRGDAVDEAWGDLDVFIGSYVAAGAVAPADHVADVMARALFRLACVYRFRRVWEWICPRLLEEAVRCTRSLAAT